MRPNNSSKKQPEPIEDLQPEVLAVEHPIRVRQDHRQVVPPEHELQIGIIPEEAARRVLEGAKVKGAAAGNLKSRTILN